MTTSSPDNNGANANAQQLPFYTLLRVFGLIVMALMVVGILYAGWIAIENWGYIGV